jgi:hypothetical protein
MSVDFNVGEGEFVSGVEQVSMTSQFLIDARFSP